MCLSFYFFYFIISAFLLSFSVWPLPSTFKELPFVGNFWVILIPRRGTKKKNLSTIHFFTSHMQCFFFFLTCFLFFSSDLQVPCCVLSSLPHWQLWAGSAALWAGAAPSSAVLSRVWWLWCSAPSASPNLLAEHSSHAHLSLNYSVHALPVSFEYFTSLAVLGTDCLCAGWGTVCLASSLHGLCSLSSSHPFLELLWHEHFVLLIKSSSGDPGESEFGLAGESAPVMTSHIMSFGAVRYTGHHYQHFQNI